MRTAEIKYSDPDMSLATWEDTFILIWHRNTTVSGVTTLERSLNEFAPTRPKGIGLVTVVEESAPMPPSDARDALAQFLERASSHIKVSAVAFEGSGFRAAAVRSVVAGLTMVARQSYPHKVFASVEEGAAWMSPQMPNPTSAKDLSEAVAELRQRLKQQAANG